MGRFCLPGRAAAHRLKPKTLKPVLERPRLGSMQRAARSDVLSRAVRMSAAKPVVRQNAVLIDAVRMNAVRINAAKPVARQSAAQINVAKTVVLKMLRVAALKKRNPAAREKPVRLRLRSLLWQENGRRDRIESTYCRR
jgi:hypothetical protein